MSIRFNHSFALFLMGGAVALLPVPSVGGAAVTGNVTTPTSTPGYPTEGYPIALYEGTCDSLAAEPAYKMGNAVTFDAANDNDVKTIGRGEPAPPLVHVSVTVESSLEDLGSQQHAIVVHASAEEYESILACGNILGAVEEGRLAIALQPTEGSSVVGVAILSEETSGALGLGENEVQATVYVFDTGSAP